MERLELGERESQRLGISCEGRAEVLHEVDLIDVAVCDGVFHGLDRGPVALLVHVDRHAPTLKSPPRPSGGVSSASRMRQAASGRRHGSGGPG